MVFKSPPASRSTLKNSAKHSESQACGACRKLKMRCVRTTSNKSCERCTRTNRTCQIPKPLPQGRKPGSTGRYQGIEKALQNLRTELKKAQQRSVTEKSKIIDTVAAILNQEESEYFPANVNSEPSTDVSLTHATPEQSNNVVIGSVTQKEVSVAPRHTLSYIEPVQSSQANSFARQGINSNPLWLIAEASRDAQYDQVASVTGLCKSSSNLRHTNLEPISDNPENIPLKARCLLSRSDLIQLRLNVTTETLQSSLEKILAPSKSGLRSLEYFKPTHPDSLRDTGADLDPVELGFVSMDEASRLFSIFFERVNPINGILDPELHTPEFVRSRSALLFTWVLAISAQFDFNSPTLAKRLRLHGEKLCKHVHTSGFKSTDIVQGYYIYLHMAAPAATIGEERIWLYTTHAFGLASNLYLDQPCRRPPSSTNSVECERLARNRERTWFRMLLFERANSAVCNRIDPFPDNDLVRQIDTWWMHPFATAADRYTSAFITLRQRIASIHFDLNRQLDVPKSNPHWVRDTVDQALGSWHSIWMTLPESRMTSDSLSQSYLRFVYMHARLWVLSFGLKHSPRDGLTTSTTTADCLHSAIQCCDIAVRDLRNIGEPLYLFMAPTWAMIFYAAVLALKLFPAVHGTQLGSDVQLLALLSELSLQLERAGTTPAPRYGIAALFGQHLRMILRTKASSLKSLVGHPSLVQENAQERMILPPSSASHSMTDVLTPYDFDPVFTAPALIGQEDLWADDFGDILKELFGQSIGTLN